MTTNEWLTQVYNYFFTNCNAFLHQIAHKNKCLKVFFFRLRWMRFDVETVFSSLETIITAIAYKIEEQIVNFFWENTPFLFWFPINSRVSYETNVHFEIFDAIVVCLCILNCYFKMKKNETAHIVMASSAEEILWMNSLFSRWIIYHEFQSMFKVCEFKYATFYL